MPAGFSDQSAKVLVSKPKPFQSHPLLCTTPTANLTPMEVFLNFLKATYHGKKFPTYFKAPSLYLGATRFINLALVHRRRATKEKREEDIMMQLHGNVDLIASEKTSITMDEIGTVTRNGKKRTTLNLLIEGAPGVGKTTLAWHLCQKWEEGELFQQWSVVVMLQLRDRRIRQAKTLNDLFCHPKPEVRQAVAKQIEKHKGNGVLLISEVYDELSPNQQMEDSILRRSWRER